MSNMGNNELFKYVNSYAFLKFWKKTWANTEIQAHF